MPKTARIKIAEEDRPGRPLTPAERSAVACAEADAKVGRLQDHDDVAKQLRRRAAEIVERASKSAKPR